MQIDNKGKNDLKKSLNLVILAITFGMAFFTITGTGSGSAPLTGFIRKLGAGDFIFGIMLALPVLGGVMQVFASYIIEITGKRKHMFLIFGFIHRFLWIPVAIIPLISKGSYSNVKIWLITALITISSISNSITGVAFSSWMGALIPPEIKGRFFSTRTMISTITGAITGVVVGWFLDNFTNFEGYAVVFIFASLMGALDIACFIWVKHPPVVVSEERPNFIRLIAEPFKNKNYLKFIIYACFWGFGVNFAAPFFNVYMLEYLNMSFFKISLFAQLLGNLATIVFIRYWGILIDRYGCKPVLTICGSAAFVLPMIWFFATPSNYYVILLINFLSGIFWPGIDMSIMNLSIWLAPEKNRSVYLANYTLFTSIFGVAIAFIAGGYYMEHAKPFIARMNIPFIFGQNLNAFHIMFAITGFWRLAATIFLLPRVNEKDSQTASKLLKDVVYSMKSVYKSVYR